MKAGRIVCKFFARDKHEVILRTPKWQDLDDLLEIINSLVEEKADIVIAEKVSRLEEIDWLARGLSSLKGNEVFYLVAEAHGKVVANSEIGRGRGGYDGHVDGMGIAIREGFRDIGIGTEIMKTHVEQAKKTGLKVLTLSAFATNDRAIHLYRKIGFTETGRVPRKHFRDGKFIDEVIMTMLLE